MDNPNLARKVSGPRWPAPRLYRLGGLAGTLLMLAGLSGCAGMPGAAGEASSEDSEPPLEVSCRRQVQPEAQIHLDLVDRLSEGNKPYAALAQLEGKPMDSHGHWVRKGRLLASTQRLSDAQRLFQALVDQCGTGEAYHGLGMVLLKSWRVEDGLRQLRIARAEAPASANIRNDYGYALLMNGEYDHAAYELRTALELADGQGPVRQNLAAAYLLTDNDPGLRMLTERYNFGVDEFAHARRLAERLRR
ncbi:hypothetical protein [Marinobacter sp. SS21]|uniref:hypothetical protein n=1 Tax=Marinobacter sp. SS21 TaxID=2979460 RepID=UPI00232E2FA5|nr:hypothetical protein [Marinobacter sp. SS21]MDC0661257.1 hypothetical protein [Marinobacter sp. SS21]